MINLDKHGISYLKFKPISSWNDDDFVKLFDAIANEHAAPVVDLPFINENIETLLSVSSCRKCGNCCRAGIMDDENASVMACKEEIEAIATETNTGFEELVGKLIKHPTEKDAWCFPLPCMYYQDGSCRIYNVRPKVCCTYPLTGVAYDDISYIAINLGCAYGKDIYKCLLKGK
ncbi:YkgJ family cysteine cluster protein [Chloroflexota bacterium]